MLLNETAFHALASTALNRLMNGIESLDEEGLLDVELIEGILTVEMPDGRQFIVNKHGPSQQLWLSSPLSGGLHFSYDEASEAWSLADGRRLDTLLKAEIEQLLDDDEAA